MLKIFKRYLKYYKKEVIFGPMFKLLEAIFELLVPLIMADIVDNGIKANNTAYVWKMGGVLLIIAVVGLCTTLVCQALAAKASQGVGTRLRNDCFMVINSFSFQELDEYGVSTLLTRINNDVNQLQLGVAMLIRLVIRAPFLVIGATVMAALISWKIALIFVFSSIIVGVVVLLIMRKTVPLNKVVQKNLESTTTITKENLSGIRVVKAFNHQSEEKQRFDNEVNVLKKNAIFVGLISAFLNPVSTIVINVAIIVVLYLSSNYVYDGLMSQGDVTALFNYLNQILVAVMVVCNLIVIFAKASACGSRVYEILQKKSSITDGEFDSYGDGDNIFEFKNVSFQYKTASKPTLNNMTFTIKENEFIGVVGGTGSGKSTLMAVMSRYYDATSGEVYYCGRNIKDYKLSFIHKSIGAVLQKASLANQTIKENLLWGNKEATDDDLNKALKIAQAYDFVYKSSESLNREIYQGGKNLSGGERQRLCIARALVKNPKVLILDDSLSALDFKTDLMLRSELHKLKMTTIMITERISSIKNADKIIVLDNGNIISIGTHDKLLSECSLYKEIYDSQAKEDYDEKQSV